MKSLSILISLATLFGSVLASASLQDVSATKFTVGCGNSIGHGNLVDVTLSKNLDAAFNCVDTGNLTGPKSIVRQIADLQIKIDSETYAVNGAVTNNNKTCDEVMGLTLVLDSKNTGPDVPYWVGISKRNDSEGPFSIWMVGHINHFDPICVGH